MNNMLRHLPLAMLAATMLMTPARAETNYGVTCKFDGSQEAITRFWSATAGDRILATTLSFTPATEAASAGVRPGTCAWDDRGFRQGEPTTIEQVSPVIWRHIAAGGTVVTVPGDAIWVSRLGQVGYIVHFKVHAEPMGMGSTTPVLRVGF